MTSDVRKAASLYESFREEPAQLTRKVTVDVPDAVAVMGTVEFIGYVTTHRGKTFLYIHEFAEGSRPLMTAGKKRNQLFLVGGRYKVTSRGITDLDSTGRAIDAPSRYKVLLRSRAKKPRT